MGVEMKVLIPGVQYGGKTNLSPKSLITQSQLQQSLRCGLKEQIVQELSVEQNHWVEFMGQSHNDVEVVDWKKSFCALFQPFCLAEVLTFWAVAIAARVIGNGGIAAAVAANIDMAAQSCGAASLNIFHGFLLL